MSWLNKRANDFKKETVDLDEDVMDLEVHIVALEKLVK